MAESHEASGRPVGGPAWGSGVARLRSRSVTLAVTVVGVATALVAPLVLTPARFLVFVLFGAFAGSMMVMVARAVSALSEQDPAEALRAAVRAAVIGAVLAVASGLLVVTLGGDGLVVVLATGLAVLGVRVLLRRYGAAASRRRDETRPAPVSRPPARSELPTPPLDHVSSVELVVAWTASRSLLDTASTPRMRAQIVALRSLYLDELERRHPEGVGRWMEAGATTGADLLGYLDGPGGGEPGPTPR